jgi:hypothetical protein
MIPFTIASKIKYLGINLMKEEKDLYSKNYVTEEKNKDNRRWKESMLVDPQN